MFVNDIINIHDVETVFLVFSADYSLNDVHIVCCVVEDLNFVEIGRHVRKLDVSGTGTNLK